MRVTADNPTDRLTPLLRPSWIERGAGFPDRSCVEDERFDAATVAASNAGVVLTESQLQHGVAFAEFLAGHHLTDAERETITDTTRAEFDDDPRQTAKGLLDISGAVARIPGFSPIVRARLRHQALTRIVSLERQRSTGPSPTMACVHRYNPVVAVSADATIVVTDDAVRAWGDLRELVSTTAGRANRWNEAAFRAEVDEGFAQWTPLQQRSLAEAHPALIATLTGLRHLDLDQLERFADAVASQATTAAAVEATAEALGAISRVNDLITAVGRDLLGPSAERQGFGA